MQASQTLSGKAKVVRSRATSRSARLNVRAAGSTYGTAFRVTTFGESHGKGVGCIIDGVPPRLRISEEEIQVEMDRRKPGQSIIVTPRKEDDHAEILSGTYNGVTLGTPIAILVRNKDQRSNDYSEISVAYRPSHADATYDMKYGVRAVAGGGRSSARETIGRCAAGAVAKKLLHTVAGTEVRFYGCFRCFLITVHYYRFFTLLQAQCCVMVFVTSKLVITVGHANLDTHSPGPGEEGVMLPSTCTFSVQMCSYWC